MSGRRVGGTPGARVRDRPESQERCAFSCLTVPFRGGDGGDGLARWIADRPARADSPRWLWSPPQPRPPKPVDRLSTMSIRQPVATAAHPALRLAGLLVVLAGLFGMHGLAGHGAAGMETMPGAVMAEAATGTAVSTLESMATGMGRQAELASGQAHRAVEAVSTSGHTGMGMGMSMAATCVAILAAELIALLLLLLGQRLVPVLWSIPRRAGAIAHPGRDPDPPSLTSLSIQRC